MVNSLTSFDIDLLYRACLHGANGVVHLHRVKDGHLLAAGERVPSLDVDFEDGARHRRGERSLAASGSRA